MRVEHIECRLPGVRIDQHLHAVANVVDAVGPERDPASVWIDVGGGEGVHQPVDVSVLPDHHVGVGVEREEGRELLHAFAQLATHQQAALGSHIVAERQLRQIAAIERNQHTAQPPTQPNAAVSLVGGEIIGIALRVIELLLASLHVHIGVGELAEIDLRAGHGEAGCRALHRHIAEDERRQPFGREAVHRIHRDPVAVGINQLLIDPIAAALRQLIHVELACGQHHLAHGAADLVSIDVDIRKVVVGADLLNLTQRILQRAPVPQPYVLERRLVAARLDRLDAGVGGKRVRLDVVERISPPRHFYIVGNEGTLPHQLIRRHDEAADIPAHASDDQVAGNGRKGYGQQPERPRCTERGRQCDDGAEDERHAHHQGAAQGDVRIGVGNARKDGALLE